MKVYFAADHAGFELKSELMNFARGELALEVEDCGAFTMDPADDYPLFIGAAAKKLSKDAEEGVESRAVVIGGSGQGEAIVANRFKGVRCALYYGAPLVEQTDMSGKQLDMIASVRQHNDANALSLGARFISVDEGKAVLKKWLETPFSGEDRHARRIRAIDGL